MKLVNNMMAATALAATAEAVVMGVKAGLDAQSRRGEGAGTTDTDRRRGDREWRFRGVTLE